MCTKYKAYLAGQVNAFLGHEAMGEVVDVAQACRVAKGDRVVVIPSYACGHCELCIGGEYIHCDDSLDFNAFTNNGEGRATMAQLMLKPDWLLGKVPEDVPDNYAALARCGLGPTFDGMQRMAVNGYDMMLITGLGPVGLGGVVNGVYRGARVIAEHALRTFTLIKNN
jgi:threonine dehydrogenase-like Zn-dependent dehydrogenase